MKTASTFLYDLVHKLTKSEKRYIKVQNGNNENDYIVLMEALLAQKHFDEHQLIVDHQGANFLKNLAVNKRYLYELVLKSLGNFGQKSIENQVSEKISATNVLLNKGLYRAAFQELKKGKKLAARFELFELLIILLGIEKRIQTIPQFKDDKRNTKKTSLFDEEKNCIQQLMNTNEYWHLNQKISQFQMQFQKIETKDQQQVIKKIIDAPKFSNADLATNTKSKIFLFQANSTYQFMLGNAQLAYENNKQFLDFLEAKPQFLKLHAERYLAVLNNLLIDSFGMGKKEMLEKGLDRLDKIPHRTEFKSIKNLESRVFRQKYLLLLNWHLRQKEYKNASALIPEIEKGLKEYGKNIEKHHRITFYYLSAYSLFINQNFDDALRWNLAIINERKEDVVKEIFYFSRVLNLLIHFELKNYMLIDSLLASTPKYLKARRPLYETEKALFSFIRKMRSTIDKNEKRILLSEFQAELTHLFNKPKEQRVFNYIDIKLWLKQFSI